MAQKSKARFIGPIIAAVGIPLALMVGYLIDTKGSTDNVLLHAVIVLGIEAGVCFVVALIMITVGGFLGVRESEPTKRT
jgi:hypothetical protein